MPVTLRDVSNYLRNNPNSRIPDAVKGTGYSGPPVKIKEGNLTNNRGKIRVATRGDNGDTSRKRNIKDSTRPLTDEEKKQNKRQNEQKRRNNKKGSNQQIGHKRRVGLTGPQLKEVEETQGTEARDQLRDKLDKAYGGIGDTPGNRELQDAGENRQEDLDWQNVQDRLGEMEEQQPSLQQSITTAGKVSLALLLNVARAGALAAGSYILR